MWRRLSTDGTMVFRSVLLIAVLVPLGCGPLPSSESPAPPSLPAESRFDPANTGSICGRLRWSGPIPNYPLVDAVAISRGVVSNWRYQNPNRLRIDPSDRTVVGVVV